MKKQQKNNETVQNVGACDRALWIYVFVTAFGRFQTHVKLPGLKPVITERFGFVTENARVSMMPENLVAFYQTGRFVEPIEQEAWDYLAAA